MPFGRECAGNPEGGDPKEQHDPGNTFLIYGNWGIDVAGQGHSPIQRRILYLVFG